MKVIHKRKNAYLIGLFSLLTIAVMVVSCSGPMDMSSVVQDLADEGSTDPQESPEPVETGISLTIPRFSPFFEAAITDAAAADEESSGDLSSKAFAVVDRFVVTVYDGEGGIVAEQPYNIGSNTIGGDQRCTFSVLEGSDYTVDVDIFNDDVSTTEAVVSGTVTGINIVADQVTPATVICLPTNPTPVPWEESFVVPGATTSAVDGGGSVLSTGGEYWVSFTAPASGALRMHSTVSLAGVDLVLGLFTDAGLAVQSFLVSEAVDGDGAIIIEGLTPGELYYGGMLPVYTSEASTNIDLTFEELATSTTFSVSYSATDADSGSVPLDETVYVEGDTVTVLGQGDLGRTGHTFAEWDTQELGGGDHYGAGATFDIGAGDVTLYAQWTPNTYTLTYYGNENTEGDPPVAQTLDYGESISLPGAGDLLKIGYHFTGWDVAAAGSGSNYPAGSTFTMGDADEELYAQWSIGDFTVSFDSRGGGAVDSQTVQYEGLITEPSSPLRTGYSFEGWYQEQECQNIWDFANDIVLGNTTLYANWTINQYTVNFDSKGGTAVDAQTVDYGSTLTLPAEPVKEGYTFAGWFKEIDCTTPWLFASDTVSEDRTLFAGWTENDYTISFNKNDAGAVGSMPTQTITLGETETLLTNSFSKEGWSFAGWAATSNGTVAYADRAPYTMEIGDVELFAKWTPNEYTITFNKNDIDASGTMAPQTIPSGSTDNLRINMFEKTGWAFLGWSITELGDVAYTDGAPYTMGTSDTTLHAKWIVQHTVTFQAQGGSQTPTQAVNDGALISEPQDPVREGYAFGGWYEEAECENLWDFTTGYVNEDKTLYAKWTIEQYSVIFNSNDYGAVGTMNTIVTDYNTTVDLPFSSLTKTGWTFEGWSTSPGGSVVYADGSSVTVEASNITLYAKWTAPVTFSLRDRGPAGGWICYDKGVYSDGWRYLEISHADHLHSPYWWGDKDSWLGPDATGTAIGDGELNTRHIADWDPMWYTAANYCDTYSVTNGGTVYNDWFLPSRDELNTVYQNIKAHGLGSFEEAGYWSSSESASDHSKAWYQYFPNGTQSTTSKSGYITRHFRAVRKF